MWIYEENEIVHVDDIVQGNNIIQPNAESDVYMGMNGDMEKEIVNVLKRWE